MKKIFLAILIVLFTVAAALADEIIWPQKSTKTASAAITTGSGVLGGILIATDGTNAVTVTVYDNTAASGTKIYPALTITSSSTDRVQSVSLPVRYYNGIYVVVSTSGTVEYTVYYKAE